MNRPEDVVAGTVVDIVVGVTALTIAGLAFSCSWSFVSVGSKFVPLRLIGVPAIPLVGLKLVIVGTPLFVRTVKFAVLVAEPLGLVTEIGPVVAEVGAVTWSWLFVAEETVAATPLNFTVF